MLQVLCSLHCLAQSQLCFGKLRWQTGTITKLRNPTYLKVRWKWPLCLYRVAQLNVNTVFDVLVWTWTPTALRIAAFSLSALKLMSFSTSLVYRDLEVLGTCFLSRNAHLSTWCLTLLHLKWCSSRHLRSIFRPLAILLDSRPAQCFVVFHEFLKMSNIIHYLSRFPNQYKPECLSLSNTLWITFLGSFPKCDAGWSLGKFAKILR